MGRQQSSFALDKNEMRPQTKIKSRVATAALDIVGALVVILDRHGRIVRFNRACEQLSGYTFDQVRGQTVWDLLLLPEEEEAVKKVFADLQKKTFPQHAENYWVTKEGKRRLIAWTNATLFDQDGQVEFVIGTGVDITEQRRAESALQQANESLESRVEERTADLQAANEELEERIQFEEMVTTISTNFLNLAPEEVDEGILEALGMIGEFSNVDRSYVFRFRGDGTMDNTHEWCADGIDPQRPHMQDIPLEHLAWSNAKLSRGEVLHIPRLSDLPPEAELERREFGRQGIVSLLAVPMVYHGEAIGFLGFDSVGAEKEWTKDSIRLLKIVGDIFVNAIEHKRALERQASQNRFLELLATGEDFDTTLHALVEMIEAQWPGMLGLILLLDETGRHLRYGAAISLPDDYLQSIEGLEIGPMVGSCGTASHCKERVIVEDIAQDPRWEGLREVALKHGLRACWSEPVLSSEGEVIATFAMYYRTPRVPTEDELQTIQMAAHLVGVAIEFKEAQDALLDSEARFRVAAQSANDLIYELDLDTGRIDWFGDVDAKLGYKAGSVPRSLEAFLNLVHPKDRDQLLDGISSHLDTREPLQEQYRVRHHDGTWRYWDDRGTAFWDPDGRPTKLIGANADITEQIRAYQILEQRVEERTQELRTLLNVSHNVASTLELQPLLGLILDQLKSVVDYTGASVMGLEDDMLSILSYRGVIPQEKALQIRFSLQKDRANRRVIETREPVIIANTRDDGADTAEDFQQSVRERSDVPLDYIASWMGVPLVARDRVIGMLSLDHSKPNFYEPRHAALAMAFANEAAVAIENAQLYEQAQELAAVEERQRLARELHDSVTQSLYSVTLYAEATARLLENAQGERAQEYLHTLGTTAREALREMRLLIFELRPPLLEQEGLMAALQTRLEAVEGRAGLQVQFEADEDLCLPYDFQKEIYRIAQEALNNVLKHAEANMVTVRLTRKRSLVTLEVVDDGTGFDTRQSSHGGMGLSGMRERVALLNGQLQIDSAPGEGTRVQIKVPCTNVGGER